MFMSSSSDEFTFSEPASKDGDGILAVPRIVERVSMFLVSAQSKRARSHVTCSPARQSWGTMVAVKWRIQGRGPGGPPFPLFLEQNEARRAEKIFFEDRPSPLPQSLDALPPSPPSEGLDPPLQSNNRSQKFLLESGRRIGFFRLGRQIRLLYNKALEICIKHEKEKSRTGPESWRDFWRILSSFISQFLDWVQWMFSFFIRPQGFSVTKWPFPAPPFFQGKALGTIRQEFFIISVNYFSEWPGNLISQADHPNCSRHLDVTCECEPYIYCS